VAKIDRDEFQKRLNEITELFASIVSHADEVSRYRCPYKNRLDQCTAHFGCRNKRRPKAPGELPSCASDDKLDYRSAWEGELPQRPGVTEKSEDRG
jgi:hypothetical protein